jgi:ABC-type phosphate transport system substrate-binding protein
MILKRTPLVAALALAVAFAAAPEALAQRDQIRIVGSSTVYPFSTKVAEQFGKSTRFKTPVIGIFGYSFLDQNTDRLHGSVIDGVEPTFDNIADQKYPVARPIFFYVKNAHVGVIPGIVEFVAEFTSDRSMGEDGYLADAGLIPLPGKKLDEVRLAARSLGAGAGR